MMFHMCSPPVWNWSPISAKFSGGFVPPPPLSPCGTRGYDDKFFWIDPCTLGKLCYNRGMNDNDKPLTNAEKDRQFDRWAQALEDKKAIEDMISSIFGKYQGK